MDASKLFICPGAQKAATTWLHRALKKHPQFWMPPQKEIDYLFHYGPSRAKYGAKIPARASDGSLDPERREWLKLFLSEWRLDKYPALFEAAGDRFSADISPNYSRMTEEMVASAAGAIAGAKIVILLRDPVERAWSHAKGTFKPGGGDANTLCARRSKFVFSKSCRLFSNYPRLVRNWRRGFGAGNVSIAFYDDLLRRPEAFINGILRFVGAADFPNERRDVLMAHENVSDPMVMPDEVRAALERNYAPMLRKLRRMLGGESGPPWLGGL